MTDFVDDVPQSVGDILEHKTDIPIKQSVSKGVKKKVNGGKRPGAGRPPGSPNKATLDIKESKKRMIERIRANTDKLINAQLNLAIGEQVLMVAHTTGKGKERKRTHEIVSDHDLIKQYLDWNEGLGAEMPGDENNFYYLTTRPANNQALDSLLNRGYGKATEKIEVDPGEGGVSLFKAKRMEIVVINADGTQRQSTLGSERQADSSEGTT